MKMIVPGLPPKTKCHFSKTESEAYTSMCYTDIGKTPTAAELKHSVDYDCEQKSVHVSSLLSKESADNHKG